MISARVPQIEGRLRDTAASIHSRSTHDGDVESNSLLDSLSDSWHWLGPAPPPMYPRISLEGLPGRAANRLRRENELPERRRRRPAFPFLIDPPASRWGARLSS